MRFYLTQQLSVVHGETVSVYWAFAVPGTVLAEYCIANNLVQVPANSVPANAVVNVFNSNHMSWPGDISMFSQEEEEDDYDGPEELDLPNLNPFHSTAPSSPSSEGQGVENPQHDFPQKYTETFVLARIYKGDGVWGDPQVVFVAGMKPQEHLGRYGDIIWSNSREKKITPYTEFEVLNGIPSNKIINTTGNFIAEYSRTPDRQWKRGVCESTFVVAVPSVWEKDHMVRATKGTNYTIKSKTEKSWASMCFTMGPFSWPNIVELFKPTYPSYTEAIKRILAGQSYSVAFTERAYVSCSPRTPNLVFGISTMPVGEINPDVPDTIFIKEKLLQQEILDVVKRNNLQLKVI